MGVRTHFADTESRVREGARRDVKTPRGPAPAKPRDDSRLQLISEAATTCATRKTRARMHEKTRVSGGSIANPSALAQFPHHLYFPAATRRPSSPCRGSIAFSLSLRSRKMTLAGLPVASLSAP